MQIISYYMIIAIVYPDVPSSSPPRASDFGRQLP